MKVCMLVHQNYFRDQRVIRYADSLLEQGHQVDAVCPMNRKLDYLKKDSPVHVNTIPVYHGASSSVLAYLLEYGVAFLLYFIVMTFRYIIRGYDVIHVHNMPDFLVFAALIPRIFGARIILDIHDPFPEFYQSKFNASSDGKLLKMFLFEERISINFVHAVITANDNFKTNLINRGIGEEKITVVRNFPDRSVYDREKCAQLVKKDSDKFILIYPGTIAPRYGLHVAIQGVAMLKAEYSNMELRIIGPETEYKQELRDLVDQLDAGEVVKIMPAVQMEEVPVLLAGADLGIYPAFPDPHMDIAIPTKVLEFTVMGLPVIASRLTVIEQLFANGSVYIFSPGNAEQFADLLRDCLLHSGKLEQTKQINDAALLPEWNWAVERERYFTLIQQLEN